MSSDRRRPVLQYGRVRHPTYIPTKDQRTFTVNKSSFNPKACQGCVLTKCRCVPRQDHDGCERCYKYSKDCVPSDSPRRRAGERNASLARIVELEQRINGFVESLEKNHGRTNASGLPAPETASAPLVVPDDDDVEEPQTAPSDDGDVASELCYRIFLQRMLKYFPVVNVPSSPEVLRHERPFLLLCIRAVTAQSTATKLRLGRQIKQAVANRLAMDENIVYEDLDLLQGLLTYIAWSHDHLLRGGSTPNVSRLTQLAVTLVYEMGLSKRDSVSETNTLPVGHIPGKRVLPRRTWPHTMEEKRTLVGCFLLTSVVSVYFGQIDPLPLTEYMRSCISAMSSGDGPPHDQALAHMAHLHSLVNDVEVLRRGNPSSVPVYDKLFQYRVDELRRTQPVNDESNGVLSSSMYFAQLNVQTLALAGGDNDDNDGVQRVTQRWACVDNVKRALDSFFLSVPAEDYDSLPFPYFAQLAGFLAVLIRLTTLTAVGWDVPTVRATIDVVQVLDRIIDNIDRARMLLDSSGGAGDGGFLERKGIIFASCRMACMAKMAEAEGRGSPGAEHTVDGMLGGHSADTWFRDVFGYGVLGVTSITM